MKWKHPGQILIPIALIVWLALKPPNSTMSFWAQVIATALALFALPLSGIWLFLPWEAPYVYGLLSARFNGRYLACKDRTLLP
jgi:hypothetical protein